MAAKLNGTAAEKLQLVFRLLAALTAGYRITTLDFSCGVSLIWVDENSKLSSGIKAAGAERLAGVLAQCPALTHLNLCFNSIEAESLAGVLGRCRELVHLNLSSNNIGQAGAESFAGVLAQFTALAHLDLSSNSIRAAGAETLAGVLAQCPALAYLDLSMQ